jgi:GAF domain-containing protein
VPKTGDLSLRTLLEKPLAMDHKVAQDTGSALRGVATLFGELYVQLPQHGLKAVSAHLCQELAALLGYPIAGLLQHNSPAQSLVPVAICNVSHRDGNIPWPMQLTAIGLPEHSAIQVCSDAARQVDEPLSTYLKEVRLLAGACVPIKLGAEVWGVLLLLDHRPSAKPAYHTRDILDLVMPLLCSLIEADQKSRSHSPRFPSPRTA